MYPSTEMLISVRKYKLQYGKISPILSTQITAPVQNNYQSLSTKTGSRTNIFIGCATIFLGTVKFMYNSTTICIPVQKYKSQYKNKSCGTKKITVSAGRG